MPEYKRKVRARAPECSGATRPAKWDFLLSYTDAHCIRQVVQIRQENGVGYKFATGRLQQYATTVKTV
jgi:hypothetical protein